jgi:hypothetical protein
MSTSRSALIQAIGAEGAAVTAQSLIEEAEQARIKAMSRGLYLIFTRFCASAVLVDLFAPQASQFGLRGNGAHCGSRAIGRL